MVKSFFNGKRTLIDEVTGERFTVNDVVKKVNARQFWKVSMLDFLNSLNLLGNKKVKVYEFILNRISSKSNKLCMNNNQIYKAMNSEGVKIGYATVARALGLLSKPCNNVITRKRYGANGSKSCIMLNPNLVMKGHESHRHGLLVEYKNTKSHNVKSAPKYKIKANKQQIAYTINGRQYKNKRRSTAK